MPKCETTTLERFVPFRGRGFCSGLWPPKATDWANVRTSRTPRAEVCANWYGRTHAHTRKKTRILRKDRGSRKGATQSYGRGRLVKRERREKRYRECAVASGSEDALEADQAEVKFRTGRHGGSLKCFWGFRARDAPGNWRLAIKTNEHLFLSFYTVQNASSSCRCPFLHCPRPRGQSNVRIKRLLSTHLRKGEKETRKEVSV